MDWYMPKPLPGGAAGASGCLHASLYSSSTCMQEEVAGVAKEEPYIIFYMTESASRSLALVLH
jgi:hypothetical protein